MNSTLPPIHQLLAITGSWKILTQNSFLAYFVEGYSQDLVIPKEYVAQAHPLLALAIEQSIAWNDVHGKPASIDGASVYATNELLNERAYHFIDKDGKDQYFTNILNIAWDTTDVGIYGKWFKVQINVIDDVHVPFVLVRTNANIKVPLAYLDEHYPGWKERYTLGWDLGMDTKELMAEVFSARCPQVSAVGIDGFTFE